MKPFEVNRVEGVLHDLKPVAWHDRVANIAGHAFHNQQIPTRQKRGWTGAHVGEDETAEFLNRGPGSECDPGTCSTVPPWFPTAALCSAPSHRKANHDTRSADLSPRAPRTPCRLIGAGSVPPRGRAFRCGRDTGQATRRGASRPSYQRSGSANSPKWGPVVPAHQLAHRRTGANPRHSFIFFYSEHLLLLRDSINIQCSD